MSEPPEVEITRGAPSAAEAEAIRRAVFELWRADQVRAARTARADAWVLSARAYGSGLGPAAARRGGAESWKLSGRFGQPV
jgi:hypothetical protein